jgi:Ca2+-binding RTX toxin-like protein
MRPFLLLLLSLLTLLLTLAPAQAAICPGVELLQPQGRLHASFRWSAERSPVVRRELVLIGVTQNADGSVAASGEAAREEAKPFGHKLKSKLKPGAYNWFVVFYDARGNILCTSPVGSFSAGNGTFAAPAEGLASPGDAAAVTVVVRGNYVVVLFGSPYLGTGNRYDELLANGVNVYDASALDLSRYSGVTIHGNDLANTLTASAGADIIFGYAGKDTLNGGDGHDVLHGGDESCAGSGCNFQGVLGDVLNGGAGNDILNGGQESCDGDSCNWLGTLGDTLNGDDGDDILNGGNENCTDDPCNYFGTIGDTLNGGNGDDTLNGGDENCAAHLCNYAGQRIGDSLDGGAGNDTLSGGDERCTGFDCNSVGNIGDGLDGGPGDDTGTGGTEISDGGVGTVADTIITDADDTSPITP